jgi:hypothetical protein
MDPFPIEAFCRSASRMTGPVVLVAENLQCRGCEEFPAKALIRCGRRRAQGFIRQLAVAQ